jgi:hypothetical protein
VNAAVKKILVTDLRRFKKAVSHIEVVIEEKQIETNPCYGPSPCQKRGKYKEK